MIRKLSKSFGIYWSFVKTADCADIVFLIQEVITHTPINRGREAMNFEAGSKGVKRGHAPPQKSARKWHKIDMLRDIGKKKTKKKYS